MWASERTEKKLQEIGKEDRRYSIISGHISSQFLHDLIICLMTIAQNTADISDYLGEMQGYDLSDDVKSMTPKEFEQGMPELTNDEAVTILECMAIDMTGTLASMSKNNSTADLLTQRLAAINMAQDALRDK